MRYWIRWAGSSHRRMIIAVGGPTIVSQDENGGEPGAEFDAELWEQPPHPSCDDTEVWSVSGATALGDTARDRTDNQLDSRPTLPDG